MSEPRIEKLKELAHDDRSVQISAAIHMIRCNLTIARAGIIENDPAIILEGINEIDRTVTGLEKKLR
jgi:hypothetical protein